MGRARYGLRTTISLHGTVVHQGVDWCPRYSLGRSAWRELGPDCPTDDGAPVARFRWSASAHPIFESSSGRLTPAGEGRWAWENGSGVYLFADRIEMKRARRRSSHGAGDMSLLVLVLSMMVGVGQLNFLLQAWLGTRVDRTTAHAPSPELIARLLQREFDGDRTGPIARVQRPQHRSVSPSFYMPAGSQGAPTVSGGGDNVGADQDRRAPTESPGLSGEAAVPSEEMQRQSQETLAIEAVVDESRPRPEEVLVTPTDALAGLPRSVERFIGWGFHDWMEASDPETKAVVEQLELARALMRLDPDEPYAILTVAYFAYLSENYTLCQDLYRRYTELYPEDAAGWNNLALTYKRAGQYVEEEGLYRRALVLDPDNSNTQNNLAVNLAHQGRFGEAEHLMKGLRASPQERPYANLHRAKIAAAKGEKRKAVRYLRRALSGVEAMDTFHHIEFRQDIRLDPALAELRDSRKVKRLLREVYGEETPVRLGARALERGGERDG